MEKKIIRINDGINLHIMPTDKFKTNTIVITFVTDLKRDTITKNALIPLVLHRGSVNYPTMKDIAIKLEDMYGASCDASSDKIGDNLVIQF